MTAPLATDRKSTSRFSFRRSTSGGKRHSLKKRFWFSSSAKLASSNDGDDLAADAAAAMREVDAENQSHNGGSYTPRVEYGSPRPDVGERDAAWSSKEQVDEHYSAIGWTVVEISKDGNCLFRAISDQLYTNELFHQDIRQRLVDFIQREQELFKPFVEDEKVSEYCTRMREDGEWGGHLELYAAAKLFNIHIVVHTGPVRRLRVENNGDEGAAKQSPPPPPPYRILHLLYKDDHYSSLHPKKDDVYATADTVQTSSTVDSSQKKSVSFQEPGEAKCVRFQLPEEDVRVPEDTEALTCEQEEVPECGVFLPQQAIFYHGKRRASGATLFSMVHVPSVKNLLEVPESPSITSSTSSTASETSSEASSSARVRPTAPTVRAVPVSYPSKTTFHKGRPVTSCV